MGGLIVYILVIELWYLESELKDRYDEKERKSSLC